MRHERHSASSASTQRDRYPHIPNKEIDMKKAICAMKAALGIRSIGGGSRWRWVHYHNI